MKYHSKKTICFWKSNFNRRTKGNLYYQINRALMESKFCMSLHWDTVIQNQWHLSESVKSHNISNRGNWKSLQISALFSHEEISRTVGMAIIFSKQNKHSSLLPNVSKKHSRQRVRWSEKSTREFIDADLKNAECHTY